MAVPITVPRYTVADLDNFPDDGNCYELLDGVLLVTPPPGTTHQGVLSRLVRIVDHAVGAPGLAWVMSPGVVVVPPETQLEPDLLVYPARFPLGIRWEDIDEHWLAVEVFTQSSKVYDRDFKRAAYQAVGIHEVWLVDPPDRSVEVWRRDQYALIRDTIHWTPPGQELTVEVDVDRLFAGLRVQDVRV